MTCPRVATAVTWRGYGTDVEISRVRFLQSLCGGATHPSVRDMYDCGSIVAWLIRLFAARRRQLAIDQWHRNAWDVSAYMLVLFNSRRSVYDSFFLCKWRCLVCSLYSTVSTMTSCYSDYEASFGIGGQAFSWIASFLQDRTQQVFYKRCLSEVPPLLFGIPQGSVLGPLLFLLYVSEMFDIVAEFAFTCHAFADDAQLYISVPAVSCQEATERFVCCLERVCDWMAGNRLKLSEDKTQIIWLGTRNQLSKSATNGDVTERHSVAVSNCC